MDKLFKGNIFSLCTYTVVNEDLLLNFLDQGIILQSLKEEIKSLPNNMEQASKLYNYLSTRPLSDKGFIINAFKQSGNETAALILQNLQIVRYNSDEPTHKSLNFYRIFVTDPVYNFSGRKNEIIKLKEMLSNGNLILISGLGGVGKTELCKVLAKEVCKENWNCIWLKGDSTDSLSSSINYAAKELKLLLTGSLQNKFLEITKKALPLEPHRLLVIVDNVDVKYPEMPALFKSIEKNQRVVLCVTSRDRYILDFTGKTLSLKNFKDKEAHQFLQNELQITDHRQKHEIQKLCELIENFPLALQQVSGYIKYQRNTNLNKRKNYTVSDYNKIYQIEEHRLKLLNHQLSRFQFDYETTTLLTWNLTFELLQTMGETGQTAVEIMKIAALMDPVDIRVEFVTKMYFKMFKTCSMDKYDIDSVLCLLNRFHLADAIKDGVFKMHRLVQEVIRNNYCGNQYIKDWIFTARKVAGIPSRRAYLQADYFPSPFEVGPSPFITYHSYIMHAFNNYVSNELVHELIKIPYQVYSHWTLFDTSDGVKLQAKLVFSKFKQIYNPDSVEKLLMQRTLLWNLTFRKVNSSHVKEMEHIRTKLSAALGQEHPETLITQGMVAKFLFEGGFYKESVVMNRECLDLMTSKLGEDHFETQKLKNGIAKALIKCGEYRQANVFLRKIFTYRYHYELHMGSEWASVLILAEIYHTAFSSMLEICKKFVANKNYGEAKELCEFVLQYHSKDFDKVLVEWISEILHLLEAPATSAKHTEVLVCLNLCSEYIKRKRLIF